MTTTQNQKFLPNQILEIEFDSIALLLHVGPNCREIEGAKTHKIEIPGRELKYFQDLEEKNLDLVAQLEKGLERDLKTHLKSNLKEHKRSESDTRWLAIKEAEFKHKHNLSTRFFAMENRDIKPLKNLRVVAIKGLEETPETIRQMAEARVIAAQIESDKKRKEEFEEMTRKHNESLAQMIAAALKESKKKGD